MNKVKTRNTLVLVHLLGAGLLAPLFILVAITGGLYLNGTKGETVETALTMPANVQLDPDSPNIEDDVRAVLAANDLPQDFEYLKMRDGSITTRPTSTDFVTFKQGDDGWNATLNQPSLQYRMMELHKGHGPQLFKYYQILAAITLFLVVIGGLVVGLLSPAYRTKTIGSFVIGAIAFALLAFVI